MSLASYVEDRIAELPEPLRRERLEGLARAIAAAPTPKLTFICTHNSRRSHLAQVWAQVGAWRFEVPRVETYSGGTEATAFDRRAVAALERAGFTITSSGDADNPLYRLETGGTGPSAECFSKVFTEPPNPRSGFIAVMTCTDADDACPVVTGASDRFTIPYDDPKASDGTDRETATYDARCASIAREMLWVMRRAATLRR